MQTGKSVKSVDELSPARVLIELTSAYWVSQAIYVVAKLGIADLLKYGAKGCDELARATNTHAQSLARVMRTLASVGVFTEVDIGRFGLTPLAEPLQASATDSIRGWAIMLGEESYRAWGELLYTVKTGKPAFDQVYNMRRFEYLDQNPCSLAPYRCRVAADEPRWRQPDVGLWSLYRGLEWARLLGATPPMRMTYMRLLESRVFS